MINTVEKPREQKLGSGYRSEEFGRAIPSGKWFQERLGTETRITGIGEEDASKQGKQERLASGRDAGLRRRVGSWQGGGCH